MVFCSMIIAAWNREVVAAYNIKLGGSMSLHYQH